MAVQSISPVVRRAYQIVSDRGLGTSWTGWWILVSLILCLGAPTSAHAQVKGLIMGPGAERFRVAVSPFKNLGNRRDVLGLSERVAEVISDDLDRSGWFKIIPRAAYIENPQATGIRLGRFDFRDWGTIGAEGLVKGGFRTRGDQITFEFRFFDVFQQDLKIGKRYSGTKRDWRRMAHKFADEIILKLTGKRGVFDTKITYVSTGGDRFKEIYVSQLDGTEKRKITNNRTINLFPSWAPDGKGIVYTSYKKGVPQFLSFNLESQRETAISTHRGLNLGGRWSPDEKSLIIPLERGRNVDLFLLNPRGGIEQRLTRNAGIDVSPTWSPGGDRIAFVSDRHGSPQIYILTLASGGIRRLTFKGSYNQSPDWSPTGELIVFTGRANGVLNIFTIRPDGRAHRMITDNRHNDEDPSWAPDGRFVAFASDRAGSRRIYTMRKDGQSQRRLTGSLGDDTDPSWSPWLP